MNDPAIDLAVISSILSSNMDTAIEPEVCIGEQGQSHDACKDERKDLFV